MAPDIKSLLLVTTSPPPLDAHLSGLETDRRLGEILPSPDSLWGTSTSRMRTKPARHPKVGVTPRFAQLSEGMTPS